MLRPDPDHDRAWVVEVDGTRQSHVDLADPTHLAFAYVRRVGHLIDLAAPTGAPLRAVHLGGGGLTLARYVAATRPGSRQRVCERDAALTELVRAELPLDPRWHIRVRAVDAREGLSALREDTADVVVCDVFADSRVPPHLTSVEFAQQARRVLAAGGLHVVNIVDTPPLAFARGQAATLAEVFGHVAMIVEPAILRGRRHGNVVLTGGDDPLDTSALAPRLAADPEPSRLVSGVALTRLIGGARPRTDAEAAPSPAVVDIPSPGG